MSKLIIFSRDDLKQVRMAEAFNRPDVLAFRVGDVRDAERLEIAMYGADAVIHAAAMKQIGQGVVNPDEMLKTNCFGTLNVLRIALRLGIPRVLVISSDKAVNPSSLYGSTKQVSEGLAVAWNRYGRGRGIRVSAVRYGNVLGSRGSVLHVFRRAKAAGLPLPVTDPTMSRFWITLPQAAEFVWRGLEGMQGGEIFVPKLPSMRIGDLAEAVDPGGERKVIGPKVGEKTHETLVSWAESGRAEPWDGWAWRIRDPEESAPAGNGHWEYRSDTNEEWLDVEIMRGLISQVPEEEW